MTDPETFKNPTGDWHYSGPFHAHVTADTDFSLFDGIQGVEIDGTILKIGEYKAYPGRLERGNCGIHLFAGEYPFSIGCKNLIRLCRLNGQIIWQNPQLAKVLIQEVDEIPWEIHLQLYNDGNRLILQIGYHGPACELNIGQTLKFKRHGTFTLSGVYGDHVRLNVTLPRKGWNPKCCHFLMKIPTDTCLHIYRNNYYVEPKTPTWVKKYLVTK